MTAANQSEVPSDAHGHQRRLWIIIAIAATIVIGGFAWQTVSSRQADERMSALRADLESTFNATTVDDFASFAYQTEDDSSTDLIDALTTNDGVAPDLVQFVDNTIQARYVIDVVGGARCVRASWTKQGVNFEDGTGARCTTADLS